MDEKNGAGRMSISVIPLIKTFSGIIEDKPYRYTSDALSLP
jgi:hypothetical protein